MEEIEVSAALDKVEIVPVVHPSSKRLGDKEGKAARQNLNRNRRLIAVEEEEAKEGPVDYVKEEAKEGPDDYANGLKKSDSRKVLNGDILINHPLIEENEPASG